MLDFDTEVAPIRRQSSEGWWQLARLCLDQAADEWVNVGIVFTGTGGRTACRFLTNLSGIKCHYNEDAVEDARFLIEQAREALEDGISLPGAWSMRLSERKFVRGIDSTSIVENLFKRLVPLAKHESSLERLDTEHHSHATASVRATVKAMLTRQLQASNVKKFWRHSPVEVMRDDHPLRIDLQIQANTKGRLFNGAITSAWYKTNYHRIASLSQAMNATMLASGAFPQARNHIYLLRPTEKAEFTQDELRVINSDIESVIWMLRDGNSIVRSFNKESDMAESILEDLALPSQPILTQY